MKSPRRSVLTTPKRRSIRKEDLRDQHPEVAALIEPTIGNTKEDDLLKSIGMALMSMRDDAKQARQSSGIEDIWRRCEDAYVGIDDSNRGEFQSAKWSKPTSSEGPVTTGKPVSTADYTRSNVYIRLTSRYVDAGFAKITEILLPPDDKAFSFTESPVPELMDKRTDKRQVLHNESGIPLTRPLMEGEQPPAGAGPVPPPNGASLPPDAAAALPGSPQVSASAAPPMPGAAPSVSPQGPPPGQPGVGGMAGVMQQMGGEQRVPLTVSDLAEENIQLSRKKAKKAETRVYDWMVETQYRAESRKVLFDSARLGVGVLKGPVPKIVKKMKTERDPKTGRVKIVRQEKIIPESIWVSCWNIFPDPTCGEKFSNGNYMFERDWLSDKQVRDLRDVPGYIKDAIDQILIDGPDGEYAKARENGESLETSTANKLKGRYEVWYFHGFLKKSELNCICEASGYQGDMSDLEGTEQIPVVATMMNDKVVKAVPAPLDSGRMPYRSMPWTRRPGHWAGVGIAEQVFAPQRMLNASVRSMLNNAGKSAGSQIVVDQAAIRPADGKWTITPDKIWYKTGDAPGGVRDVFELYKITNVTNELMVIIDFALKMAEENTSIPLITQGQTAPTTPETLGAVQIQNSNANQLLRSIGYSYDDHMTEPLVIDYYEWLLLDPDIPEDEKGDFHIDAHGSVAMVERAIQDQTILQLGPLAKDPAYGIDPKRWAKQMIMSKKLNPADFKYSPEEQQKIDSMPPPVDPRIEVAKITMKGWVDEAKVKATSDDMRTKVTADVDLQELNMKREIALLNYANEHKINIAQVESQLAQTAMKLQAQERISKLQEESTQVDRTLDLHKHRNPVPKEPKDTMRPPVQLPGRAKKGEAFSQDNK